MPVIAEPEIDSSQSLDGVTGFLLLMSEGLIGALESAHGPEQANQVSRLMLAVYAHNNLFPSFVFLGSRCSLHLQTGNLFHIFSPTFLTMISSYYYFYCCTSQGLFFLSVRVVIAVFFFSFILFPFPSISSSPSSTFSSPTTQSFSDSPFPLLSIAGNRCHGSSRVGPAEQSGGSGSVGGGAR